MHEYVVAHIRIPSGYDLPDHIWIKCERFPIRTSIFKILSSKPAPADDKVTLSIDFAALHPHAKYELVMHSQLNDARLYHLVDILSIIRRNSGFYVLKSQNCWFFAASILGALQCLPQTWISPAKTAWIKKGLEVLDSQTRSISEAIHESFLSHWVHPDSRGEGAKFLDKGWLTISQCPSKTLTPVS